MRAARETGDPTVLLGGGVVANSRLPERMSAAATGNAIKVRYPPVELSTDNVAMIAGASRIARGDRPPDRRGPCVGARLMRGRGPCVGARLMRGRRDFA
jgi:N6-L-threonylcarbamoyladenine synthase